MCYRMVSVVSFSLLPTGNNEVYCCRVSVEVQAVGVLACFLPTTKFTCANVSFWSDLLKMFPQGGGQIKKEGKNALIKCQEEENNLVTN